MGEEKNRQCSPCTACCDGWLQINVYDVQVYPGHPCPHVSEAGCQIYPDRPVFPCRIFECGWVTDDSPLPDWMRPDLANVIVIFNKYRWKKWQIDGAIYAGGEIGSTTLDWLKCFTLEHGRQLIVTGVAREGKNGAERTTITVFGPENFRRGISVLMSSGRFLQEVEGFSSA